MTAQRGSSGPLRRLFTREGLPAIVLAVVALYIAGPHLLRLAFPPQPGQAPHEVSQAVAGALSEARCTTATEAAAQIRASLEQAGYRDWTIYAGTEIRPDKCVSASIDTASKRVRLSPALSPGVRIALASITTELIDNCFERDEAIARVTGVLERHGETDFKIRTDGPLTAPVDRIDEVLRHIDAGCWVYSGTGWTEAGVRIYYVSGR